MEMSWTWQLSQTIVKLLLLLSLAEGKKITCKPTKTHVLNMHGSAFQHAEKRFGLFIYFKTKQTKKKMSLWVELAPLSRLTSTEVVSPGCSTNMEGPTAKGGCSEKYVLDAGCIKGKRANLMLIIHFHIRFDFIFLFFSWWIWCVFTEPTKRLLP